MASDLQVRTRRVRKVVTPVGRAPIRSSCTRMKTPRRRKRARPPSRPHSARRGSTRRRSTWRRQRRRPRRKS